MTILDVFTLDDARAGTLRKNYVGPRDWRDERNKRGFEVFETSNPELRTSNRAVLACLALHAPRSGLDLQFGLDRAEKSFHVKRLLKRTTGPQHLRDVEKVEDANHVATTGDGHDLHVRKFPS